MKTALFMASLVLAAFLIAAPDAVLAQSLSIDFGGDSPATGSTTSRILQLILIVTVLSMAPTILMMVTSFTRIIVVLSLLRSAMGVQQTPPNAVLISLAFFLTMFVMGPTMELAYENGIKPLINEEITELEAVQRTAQPFHSFMMQNVRAKDLALFIDIDKATIEKAEDTPFRILIPAFMISELKRAFEIGFLIFIPFLIIDMMISATLMSMGMMMLPPVLISLPFKIIFFVLVDGWYMISSSLVESYNAAPLVASAIGG